MKVSRLRERLTALLIVILLAASPGCIGPNKLGTSLYKWNTGLSSEKWTIEIVFATLYLTGVYPFCGFVDLFILNSLEFWSKDELSLSSTSDGSPGTNAIVEVRNRILPERADPKDEAAAPPVSGGQ